MSRIVALSPFRCRMWMLHDRIEEHITEESCQSELASFEAHGQLVPVLGRTLRGDPDHDVELIYGARRLFVARHLNQPLMVDLRQLSDREAIVAMDIENRQRVDLSPYERGLSYARWLSAGYFSSQDDLARALKVSASVVSRLLTLARLPAVVIDAFADPAEIRERWAPSLAAALDNPAARAPVVQKARSLGGDAQRASGRYVFRQLMLAASTGSNVQARHRDEVVTGASGRPLFRLRWQSDAITLVLPARRVSAKVLQGIRESIAEILQREAAGVLPLTVMTGRAPEHDVSEA
jgi:ParB family transcriptional regulator, chromosome partitioning protein